MSILQQAIDQLHNTFSEGEKDNLDSPLPAALECNCAFDVLFFILAFILPANRRWVAVEVFLASWREPASGRMMVGGAK